MGRQYVISQAMTPTRRTFLQTGAIASVLGFDLTPAHAQARELKISRTTETRSTCPYCSVSCGIIIHTLGDAISPGIIGKIRDHYSLNLGFVAVSGTMLIGGLFWLWGMKYLQEDTRAAPTLLR